jgi:hypothetical protein
MKMAVEDMIRVKTASDMMHVTSQYVYTLIKNDRLNSVEIDGVAFVSRKEVEVLQAEREKNKRH